MAVYEVSCNLSGAQFPFGTEMWGRTIMFPQYDENYDRTIFSTVDPSYEKGLPQVYYMHNVMPTVNGYQAVGYDITIAVTPSGPVSSAFGSFVFGKSGFGAVGPSSFLFNSVYQIQTPLQNNFLFVPAGGKNYIYDATTSGWNSVSPLPPGDVPDGVQVTTAFVQGQTYIYYANYGCFVYDELNKVLVPTTLTGLDPLQIAGICTANGYMVAVSKNAVAWSSLTTPTDFTPSIVTGAGGGSINDAKGVIIAALQITGGFILYCQQNAVGATYTGNSNFPFIFLEIAGSGGIQSIDQISWHANMPAHVMLGTYGLQEINKSVAKGSYIEASDFLAAKLFEDFDESTQVLTSQYISAQLKAKVTIIEARYLVISYGVSAAIYTHALVYDLILKRWGKLKVEHSACFEWNAPNLYGFTTYGALSNTTYGDLSATTYGDLSRQIVSKVYPKKSIAFLQGDGTVLLVNFDLSEAVANGVFMIGKFQFSRRKWIQHQYGIVDTISDGNRFSYTIIPTKDGKTLLPFILGRQNLALSGEKTRTYQKQVSGVNISVLLQGQFSLNSLLLGFTVLGNR